jgi:hypothetical protein
MGIDADGLRARRRTVNRALPELGVLIARVQEAQGMVVEARTMDDCDRALTVLRDALYALHERTVEIHDEVTGALWCVPAARARFLNAAEERKNGPLGGVYAA